MIALYLNDIAPHRGRPHEIAARATRLLTFWGDKMLSEVNGRNCRTYAKDRGDNPARRELADLGAAINYHRREGLCSEVVSVTLPSRPASRDRWLTRDEAARLIWAAWRYRERQRGTATRRHTRRHIARFILVALYTGTRSGAVCAAALRQEPGRSWIDVERGVFYRRAPGVAETKKRQPAIPLPDRLLAHVRRWKRLGHRYVVEHNGEPVETVKRAFRRVADEVGLNDVTPHTLRHTAATWMMQNGAEVWDAAGYLGMTPEILVRVYGHHHPLHLESARAAITARPPRGRHANAVNEPGRSPDIRKQKSPKTAKNG